MQISSYASVMCVVVSVWAVVVAGYFESTWQAKDNLELTTCPAKWTYDVDTKQLYATLDLSSAAIIDCAAIDLRHGEPICEAEEHGDDNAGDNDDDDDHDAVIQQPADTAMDESQEAGNDVHDLDVISLCFLCDSDFKLFDFHFSRFTLSHIAPREPGPRFFCWGEGFSFSFTDRPMSLPTT